PVDGFSIPFLAVCVSKRDLDLYLDEAFDLNYLMEFKSSIRSYVFDISKEKNGYFHLKYVDEIHAKKDHYLPDAGFFARNHTRHYKKNDPKYVITHTYYIDGRWTTADFSRFYAKLSDLYAIYTIADVVDDNVTAEEKLEAAITSYTVQGGGSYRGSFRDLGDAANDNYPLKVSRIQYASPGRIDVKGIERPLRFVDGIIDGFLDRKENLKENARNLYIILQHDGALGNRM
ncbi:hypothetical protein, partial [Devosia riboflavina]|uniref:hypothetical protein n=1 Tax=Devosia riboflavina TaxID=46914 RepID=UPI001363A6C9